MSDEREYWFTSSSGRIEICFTKEEYESMPLSGQCDDTAEEMIQLPAIREQLDKITDEVLAGELAEYGAWSDEDLKDRKQNELRLIWIAASDVKEEQWQREQNVPLQSNE